MSALNFASKKARTLFIVAAAVMAATPVLADVSTFSGTGTLFTDTGGHAATGTAVTISLSGSTAMRDFTAKLTKGLTLLAPGATIKLNTGASGAEVTYAAPSGNNTSYNLAMSDFTAAASVSPTAFEQPALRVEWHEQGSVEGILEMANDQIGYVGGVSASSNTISGTPLIDPASRNPVTSPGNPIWVNRNSIGTSGNTSLGLNLSIGNPYNTYSTTNYDATGKNLLGGQNRVQMAISDVNAIQGFAVSGANGSVNSTPQTAGYGKGNSVLGNVVTSLPSNAPAPAGAAYQLVDQAKLNMETSKINPAAGAAYVAGPWNSAGLSNLQSTSVAVTATLFVANPGTGLTKLNRSDAQWLQTAGRLANGADFNMTTRDVGSGTRNVAALNTGIDPTFAVGENDNGNGNDTQSGFAAQDQLNVGPNMRFSNKTAGGGQLRPTVQNNRMAVGTLSMGDAQGVAKNNSSTTPLRGLAYSDTANDTGAIFVLPNATTITDTTYVIYQNEQYVTVKDTGTTAQTALTAALLASGKITSGQTYANASLADQATAWAALTDAQTNIKGDNSGNDVSDVRANILNSVATFPQASVANPADQLLANKFILPELMLKEKSKDGLNQSDINPLYAGDGRRGQFLGSSYANNFVIADPSAVTTGSSSYYGGAGNNLSSFAGGSTSMPINANNYLFGNFNQNSVRDFNAVKSALAAEQALASSAGVSAFAADGNLPANANTVAVPYTDLQATPVAHNTLTKGDLIIMGDFNGDGKFNGQDLYLMARGAALADSTSTDRLTTGDYRTGVLRKNAALDYLQTNTTAGSQVRLDAANVTNDPTGAHAFDKHDVNRDGVVDFNDAILVDKLNTKSVSSMTDQLAATQQQPVTGTIIPVSLVDVAQTDGAASIGTADLTELNTGLAGSDKSIWYGYNLAKTGTGTINEARTGGTVTVNSGAAFAISAGTVNVGKNASGPVASFFDVFTDSSATASDITKSVAMTVSATGLLDYAARTGTGGDTGIKLLKLNSLTVNTGGQVKLESAASNSDRSVLIVGSLNVDSATGTKLDLGKNDLVVHSGTIGDVNSGITGMIHSGAVTTTASNPTGRMALGSVKNSDQAVPYTSFDGQTVVPSDVLVRYTYFGDANLNGKVDGADYTRIDAGYGNSALKGWYNGDFNYDGKVDGSDYSLIDGSFGASLAQLPANPSGMIAAPAGLIAGPVAVPEPTTLGLLLVGGSALLARRTRKIKSM